MYELPPKKNLALLPTPLYPLDKISQKYGGPRIWIKRDDLTGSILGGNKVRKLEYILHEVERDGVGVLLTCGGWNSNHCRATAFVAAQLGLKSHLILRDDGYLQKDGNFLLDNICGAEISVYSLKKFQSELNDIFDHWEEYYRSKGLCCRIIPTGGSDATGVLGYYGASLELMSQFKTLDISPEYVFCATGSGGTQAGLTLGFALLGSRTRVTGVAVCDSKAYFNGKVLDDLRSWRERYYPAFSEERLLELVSPRTLDDYIGPGYAREYPEVIATIQEVAAGEGVLLDPIYTAKAFWGLLSEIKSGRLSDAKDVVFVHTGGLFGIFPYRESFV